MLDLTNPTVLKSFIFLNVEAIALILMISLPIFLTSALIFKNVCSLFKHKK
ncbi:Uncharacterised protein [Photobacterium damselae]|uniref:Uncharacterized protein n=1 Tax=Photobacterium damselae TaxID=38293 RepID=A0A2X1ZHC0_PHODM|nr:Uncharacterised protein [Photobacterium damselae]SUB90384.1 Uncharacterised protein [Photobacterium damselae]